MDIECVQAVRDNCLEAVNCIQVPVKQLIRSFSSFFQVKQIQMRLFSNCSCSKDVYACSCLFARSFVWYYSIELTREQEPRERLRNNGVQPLNNICKSNEQLRFVSTFGCWAACMCECASLFSNLFSFYLLTLCGVNEQMFAHSNIYILIHSLAHLHYPST